MDNRAEDALKCSMEAGAGPGERESARWVGERAARKGEVRRLQLRQDADKDLVPQVDEMRLVELQALVRWMDVRASIL